MTFWALIGHFYFKKIEMKLFSVSKKWATFGNFEPKLMTKIEVILQKLPKSAKIAKIYPFRNMKSKILNFPTGTTTHTC